MERSAGMCYRWKNCKVQSSGQSDYISKNPGISKCSGMKCRVILFSERDCKEREVLVFILLSLELFECSKCVLALIFFKCLWDYLCGGITHHFYSLYVFLYWKRKPFKILDSRKLWCFCECVCVWYCCSLGGPTQSLHPPPLGLGVSSSGKSIRMGWGTAGSNSRG